MISLNSSFYTIDLQKKSNKRSSKQVQIKNIFWTGKNEETAEATVYFKIIALKLSRGAHSSC